MNKAITIREQEVIVDKDLAELCQIKTKVLNQAVKRNIERFSETDRFQLNNEDFLSLRSQKNNLRSQTVPSSFEHGGQRYPTFVFTKKGVKIVAEILKKDIQIDSIFYKENEQGLILNNDDLRSKIHNIRGEQVMLDVDLAQLYQVETKRLNEQVKRNIDRFPKRFRFQLEEAEFEELVINSNLRSQFATSSLEHGGRRYLPFVFNEQGIAMLASVLNSKIAIHTSIKIIDTFVQMRKLIANNVTLFQRLGNIEQKLIANDIKSNIQNKNANDKFDILFAALEAGNLKPKQGIFYNEEVFDAYAFVSDLIKQAVKSIILIDNYIDESVLTMFLKRNKNCELTIYTQKISEQLQLDLDKHNKQYDNITVKIFKHAHDSFLILDNKEIYHFGASLKNQGYIALLKDSYFSNYFMYLWLKKYMKLIINSANGSTFLEISKTAFRNVDCIIPNKKRLSEFDEVIKPIFEKIKNNAIQIQTLTKTCDEMLPKLMSGEIKVKL